MHTPLVQIDELTKSFGGVRALERVTLDIDCAEVHAICGENGAGKSTLIKVLTGSLVPDSGAARVRGKELRLGSVRDAEAAGLSVVHQEPTSFPHLNARDNIFVGHEPKWLGGLLLDRRRMRIETTLQLRRLSESFDQRRPVGELPLAQRQMVSIARALSRDCRLLVMDEPTSSLSERETQTLTGIVRRLRRDGVSILFVSHRLDEVFELADRISVLRDGKLVATRQANDLDKATLIHLMVGRDVPQSAAMASESRVQDTVCLDVDQLSRTGAFRDVTFQVHRGEIVGMAGLVGAGRSEVAKAVFGVDRADQGTVRIDGIKLPPGNIQGAMRRGVALVPEDRQLQGLVLPDSVRTNLCLTVLRKLARFGWSSLAQERQLARRVVHDFSVRAPGIESPAQSLSGGNQQKLVLGKWLATDPKLLILDEPTRGVDVGAKEEIHQLIRGLASRGIAVLLISSELPEVLQLSDRVVVMREGRISGQLSRERATQENVLNLAVI